jgi:hypothetical protein
MCLIELNIETRKIKQLIKMISFYILFKTTLIYQTGFLHYFFSFKQLYKTILFTSVIQTYKKTNSKHQGRKIQGSCVQGDYKHFGNQTYIPIRSILFRSILYKG